MTWRGRSRRVKQEARSLVRNLSGKERRCTDLQPQVSADGVTRRRSARMRSACEGLVMEEFSGNCERPDWSQPDGAAGN